MIRRFGVIDIGTNTIKVKITDVTPGGQFVQVLYKDFPSCLGKSIDKENVIPPESLAGCYQALRDIQVILRENHVEHYSCIATHALRVATNQAEIIDLFRTNTGLAVNVITGEEESKYSLWGVLMDFPTQLSFACINAGGGSTELAFHNVDQDQYSFFDFGAVNLYTDFIKGKSNLDLAIAEIEKHISKEYKSTIQNGNTDIERIISVGGSIFNAGYIYKRDKKRIFERLDGLSIPEAGLKMVIDQIKSASNKEKENIPGLDFKRRDTILTGTLIHYCLLRILEKKEITISTRTISDGIMYGMANGKV